MPGEHEEKMVNLTRQMRHNQDDLKSFLSDLDSWETDIKKKEETLLTGDKEKTSSLPPVRNTIHKKKLKKKKKEKVVDPDKQKKKISGFDFRSWDQFDVDEALKEIDHEEKKETSSSEYETDEEWELERKRHLSGIEKDKGNAFFKKGEYDKAIEAYTKGIEFDSTNAVLPANRAMALLKQQKYAAAELDCTLSISLDPVYVKAYLRRATARAYLSKHKEAVDDYNRVLDLEPTNKLAQTELERLQKEKERGEKTAIQSTLIEGDKGRVNAIYKSPEERSKVPLKRIPIEEIGIEPRNRNQQPLTEQSATTKKITEREEKNFENLISAQSATEKVKSSLDEKQNKPFASSLNDKQSKSLISELDEKADTRYGQNSKKTKTIEKPCTPPINEVKVNGNLKGGSQENCHVSSNKTECPETIPSIPITSFQFQTDFKMLKNKPEAFFKYFTAISPDQYPSLFGQCLDADILQTIVKSLLNHCHGSSVDIYRILFGMTGVKRFSMTAMFLSRKDKQGIQELMTRISSSNLCSTEELSSLKKKYDL